MKTCTRCGESKPLGDFYVDINRPSGVMPHCKACCAAAHKVRYEANLERERARGRAYYQANRERKLAQYHAIRAQAVAIYGGACAECGSDADLQFDHPDWDGGEHRKVEAHQSMYRRIVQEGQPIADRRLRLLCQSCHRAQSSPRVSPRLARARKHEHILTTLPRKEAAAAIGVAPRTVQHWRQALRLAGVAIPDGNHPWTRSASS